MDVEQQLATGGGGNLPPPPPEGNDPWGDGDGGGDGDEPRDPDYNNHYDFSGLDDFTKSYVEAALWTEEGSINESGWNVYTSAIHVDCIQPIIEDCHNFMTQASGLLEEAYDHGYSMSQAGHDFWLTRNGHGAGFWDRDLGELGDKLSNLAKTFGEVYVHSGDEGQIYFE